MAEAMRFRTVVSGNTLTLSDLDRFAGKCVEVIVFYDDEPDAATERVALEPRRRFGTMAGQIKVAEDFDAPLPHDLQRAFEGNEEP